MNKGKGKNLLNWFVSWLGKEDGCPAMAGEGLGRMSENRRIRIRINFKWVHYQLRSSMFGKVEVGGDELRYMLGEWHRAVPVCSC